MIKFGENEEGYSIPVLNEREIRASAGILLLLISISIMRVAFKGDFLMLKIHKVHSPLTARLKKIIPPFITGS